MSVVFLQDSDLAGQQQEPGGPTAGGTLAILHEDDLKKRSTE